MGATNIIFRIHSEHFSDEENVYFGQQGPAIEWDFQHFPSIGDFIDIEHFVDLDFIHSGPKGKNTCALDLMYDVRYKNWGKFGHDLYVIISVYGELEP